MPYSTKKMLRDALAPGMWENPPEPGAKTGTAADLEDSQLDDAIAEADSLIDSYIGAYYSTPVAPVDNAIPHPIDYWSRNIAAYNATLTNRRNQPLEPTSPISLRYQQTMTALTAVKNGSGILQLPAQSGDNAIGGSQAPINPYIGNLFGLEDFGLAPEFGLDFGVGRWWGP